MKEKKIKQDLMNFEVTKKQLELIIQMLDVSLKVGGIKNLKAVSELLNEDSQKVEIDKENNNRGFSDESQEVEKGL